LVIKARVVPKIKAMPSAKGKALAKPVRAMAATSKMLPSPQKKPPSMAQSPPIREKLFRSKPPRRIDNKTVQTTMLQAKSQ